MRIGIDARMYGPKQGGLGRYIEQLIKKLEKYDSENEYIIFLRKKNWDEYHPENPKFKKILADVRWYGLAEQIKMPKIINQQKVDLMHFPHWNVPYFYKEPFIVTIHDLLLLHYPTKKASTLGPITYWFKNLAFKKVLQHAASKAKQIISPCEFTRQDINQTLNVPLEKIVVTYLAPSDYSPLSNPGLSRELRRKYNITKPYALYVGVAFPHKNLEGLIKAWEIFEKKYTDKFQLILVGKKNFFYDRLINSELFKKSKNVIYTDYLNDSELSEIYSGARLYVFPSLYEGFGLPPLEAMQHEIPVISSNSTCLPEILGDSAYYFDPHNYNQIADAIYMGFTDEKLREKLINSSKNTIQKYSWDSTAKETLIIYKRFSK